MNPENVKRIGSEWLWVGLFTLLALALCLSGSGRVLTGDEATTFLIHSGDSWRNLIFSYQGPNQHTLFSLLSILSVSLFGEGEIPFRLPSLLAGVLSVPLCYLVARRLFKPRIAAVAGAFLMALSHPHLVFSQDGRAYSLTVFLALGLVFSALKLLEGERTILWGLLFGVSGFALVLALPGNLHFFLAGALFFLLEAVKRHKGESFSFKQMVCLAAPVLICLALIGAYFLILYPDLVQGKEIYRNYSRMFLETESGESPLLGVLEFWFYMVPPWGMYLLVFAVFGWRQIHSGKGWGVLILFLAPIIPASITDTLGPPRTYVYWLPFVLMLAAGGAVEISRRITNKYSEVAGMITAVLIAGWGIYHPITKFKEYDPTPAKRKFSRIEEARRAQKYLREVSPHQLVVFPYEDRVLRRYLEDPVGERMWNIFQDGKLDGITFLAHRSIPVAEIPLAGIHSFSPLREDVFERVREFGELRVYRLKRSISRFIPDRVDRDYEGKLLPHAVPGIEVATVSNPKIAGDAALQIKKQGADEFRVYSPFIKAVEFSQGSNFLLLVYAKKFTQQSTLTWVASGGMKPQNGLLNFFFGVFRDTGSNIARHRVHPHHIFRDPVIWARKSTTDFFWQIVFGVYEIEKGSLRVAEGFRLLEGVSYFDGIQSFLLTQEPNPGDKTSDGTNE